MGISAVKALCPHPSGDGSGIRSQTSDGDSNMVINREDLLLMAGKLTGSSLQSNQHSVGVGLEANSCGTLLDSFHGILNL
jgi:hypothetical protein